MITEEENKIETLAQHALKLLRSGLSIQLATLDENGDIAESMDFLPATATEDILSYADAHPNSAVILLLAANGLIGVNFNGEGITKAMEHVSHNDLPATVVIDGPEGRTILYSVPHGVNTDGLVGLAAEHNGVTITYMHSDMCVFLPPTIMDGVDYRYSGNTDEMADAPAWVMERMDCGPLTIAGLAINRPTGSLTRDELEEFAYDYDDNNKAIFNANRFAEFFKKRIKCMRSKSDEYYVYASGVWVKIDDVIFDAFIRDLINAYMPDSWTPAIDTKIRKTLPLAIPTFDPSDEPRWGINLANGIMDLSTFEVVKHHSNYKSTVRIPVAFDQTAGCPRMVRFLHEIFEEDQDRVATVQEFMGYCLTAETRGERALGLVGPGANGKSVYLNVLRALVGPMNVSAVSLSSLQGRFSSYSLVGKLINISAENELRGSLNTELFKLIVSGDPLQVEKKFKQGFTFRPYCKLVLAMNSLPRTDDISDGFTRRLLLVPCRRIFKPEEADRHLTDKLLAELPGILNFALDGLKRLRDQDFLFTESQTSREAWQEYRMMLNPYIAFVTDTLKERQPRELTVRILKVFSLFGRTTTGTPI